MIAGPRWLITAGLAVAIAAIGLSGGAAAAPTSANGAVTIRDFSFAGGVLTINAGDSVTWTNGGQVIHTVTSKAGTPERFDSGSVSPRGQFSRTFNVPGIYGYECAIHGSSMSGTVTVVAAPRPTAAPVVQAAPPDSAASAPADTPSDSTASSAPSDSAGPPPADTSLDTGSGDASSGDQPPTDDDAGM